MYKLLKCECSIQGEEEREWLVFFFSPVHQTASRMEKKPSSRSRPGSSPSISAAIASSGDPSLELSTPFGSMPMLLRLNLSAYLTVFLFSNPNSMSSFFFLKKKERNFASYINKAGIRWVHGRTRNQTHRKEKKELQLLYFCPSKNTIKKPSKSQLDTVQWPWDKTSLIETWNSAQVQKFISVRRTHPEKSLQILPNYHPGTKTYHSIRDSEPKFHPMHPHLIREETKTERKKKERNHPTCHPWRMNRKQPSDGLARTGPIQEQALHIVFTSKTTQINPKDFIKKTKNPRTRSPPLQINHQEMGEAKAESTRTGHESKQRRRAVEQQHTHLPEEAEKRDEPRPEGSEAARYTRPDPLDSSSYSSSFTSPI